MSMETSPSSPPGSPAPAKRKDPLRSRVGNGSALLTNIDHRSAWYRRFKDCLFDHLSDVPNATSSERSIIRRAATLEVELERFETKFANAGEASDSDLDLYQRTAGNLRRLLESIGFERRPKAINDMKTFLAKRKHIAAVPPAPTTESEPELT
jgi:hypothetical protein